MPLSFFSTRNNGNTGWCRGRTHDTQWNKTSRLI